MKSPAELSKKLARQWQSADQREQRLLADVNWPLRIAIGKPTAEQFKHSSALVRKHVQRWREEKIGTVEWQAVKYQAASTTVDIPTHWCLQTADEWVAACRDKQISSEFRCLSDIINGVDGAFHRLLVRQRSLWQQIDPEEVRQCCRLALLLKPGIAAGRPLRALSLANIDSKFIENHRSLLSKLLNIRFSGALEDTGLEVFLGAAEDNEHWLLVVPLSTGLFPFQQLRLRASELAQLNLPGSHLLVVENEQCHHQLPKLDNTLAILGAGLNLSWLANPYIRNRQLAYWGDIDTWGLKMLSIVRSIQPHLSPLLMDQETFDRYQQHAVAEPQNAGDRVPESLTDREVSLYQHLLEKVKGRLEQEFIHTDDVHRALKDWRND